MLPYHMEYIPTEDAQYDEYGQPKLSNNLNDEECRTFYLTIKDALCEMPFSCAMVLQGMAYRTKKTYVKAAGYQNEEDLLSNETVEERLITLQICNNHITDDIINAYINYVGGDQLLMKLNETKVWSGEFNSVAYNATQFKTLCNKYTDEMNIFIARVKNHPAMQQIGV